MIDRLQVERHPTRDTGPAIRPEAAQLHADWDTDPRWAGIDRPVQGRGRGAAPRARCGSSTRWRAWAPSGCGSCCTTEPYVAALGALTGNQAVQQVKAGLKAIYLSGWQVAADANLAGQMYPDQSLYPANSVPEGGQADQPGAPARRPDPARRRQAKRHPLVRADRGRRRGRLRRAAERLRADEGDDRGRRGRRPLRGSARLARRSAATWAARC